MPFFSVIVPVYNVSAYLERCMQSILAQSDRDFELILVDDGSTDCSGQMCDDYAGQHDFIRVIHKPNGGLASARNAGTDEAAGQYVVWLDSDDWVEPSLLSRLHEVLETNPVDFVKFNYYRYEEKDIPICGGVRPGLYPGGEEAEKLLKQVFYGEGYQLSACLHCVKRELLDKYSLRFVSERIVGSEDYLLILEMMMQAQSAAVLDDCLYHYYCRPGSLTQTIRYDIPQRYTKLYGYLQDYLKENGLEAQYGADIRWYYVWKLIHNCCFPMEYRRPENEGRANMKKILAMPEFQRAVRRSLLSGRSAGQRVQTLAMMMGCEPVFYYLFAGKGRRKKKL